MVMTTADPTLDLLADVAASFARPDAARTRAVRDGDTPIDRTMWARLADNGWLSILVPEEQGGAGLGADAMVIVARRLGYAAFPEPFVAAGVLAPAVIAAGDREALLADVIGGTTIAGVGWQADTVNHDGTLTGTSRFIPVPGADVFVVAARTAGGLGLYVVPADATGLSQRLERTADGSSSVALTLDHVAADELVGPARGEAVLTTALDLARVANAAELLGIMDRALELTIEFVGQRKQFGRPIGSFQALQHRIVDMWIQRELTGAALDLAVRAHLDPAGGPRERAITASGANARASAAAPRVCTEAMQLHGAIGFTDEYDLGLYINRALTLAPWLGNATEQRRRHAAMTATDEDVR